MHVGHSNVPLSFENQGEVLHVQGSGVAVLSQQDSGADDLCSEVRRWNVIERVKQERRRNTILNKKKEVRSLKQIRNNPVMILFIWIPGNKLTSGNHSNIHGELPFRGNRQPFAEASHPLLVPVQTARQCPVMKKENTRTYTRRQELSQAKKQSEVSRSEGDQARG